MKDWLRPSLLRRTVLTLLATLVLVWVVLSLKDYWVFKSQVSNREALGQAPRTLIQSLDGFDTEQARWAMLAADRQYNALRRNADPQAEGALLFQLNRVDGTPETGGAASAGATTGTLVYRSAPASELPDLLRVAADAQQVWHQGRPYWPVVQQDHGWRMALWIPAMADGTALAHIGLDVLAYVLLALPLVVLPMVWAVWRGLLPLRTLVSRMGQRTHNDLSPLQEPTGYAELAPLVEAFNTLLGRARHQREREQAFVQDAAHELKTPLAVVAAQAHVLATAPHPQARAQALQALEQGVERASHQVSQLLALAALEHSATGLAEPSDVVDLTRQLLIDMAPLAERRGVDMSLDSPDTLADTLDVQAFRSILDNLLKNALVHCPPGSSVEVTLARSGTQIHLRVADNGPGIARADRARVFDRFYRAAAPTAPGSGLGLAIVQRAAERMQAQVVVEDGLGGRGVAFGLRWQTHTDN